MGLGPELAVLPSFAGLRSHGFGRTLELPWPEVKGSRPYGYVVTRKDLDAMVATNAAKAGATLWEHTEAAEPIMEGRSVRRRRAWWPKVRTGTPARSRRAMWSSPTAPIPGSGGPSGTSVTGLYPQGMALRGYWTSPRHDEPWIDSSACSAACRRCSGRR